LNSNILSSLPFHHQPILGFVLLGNITMIYWDNMIRSVYETMLSFWNGSLSQDRASRGNFPPADERGKPHRFTRWYLSILI
jgi:hypothetical protein